MSVIKYRKDIDGLRALAILPVLFFHAGIPGFSGGFVGVDVFFVISGFLITSIIVREVKSGNFSFTSFWVRRAKRIMPAAVVMVVAVLIAGWYFLAPNDYFELGRSARTQAFFAANFFFWQEAGYFDGASELKPLLHTWSLAVEEQFYMVFPVIFIALNKYLFSKTKMIIVLLFFSSLILSAFCVVEYPAATFYLLPMRAWELLLGSLLALSLVAPLQSAKKAELISLAGFLSILYSVVAYDNSTVFPGLSALLPTVGAAAIIWANEHHDTWVKKQLSFRPFVFVGLISYSLYLWHWPVIVFSRYVSIEELLILDKLVLIGISVLLAVLSWRFIETPFRKYKLLKSNKRVAIAVVTSILVVAAVGQQIRRTEGYPERLPEQARAYALSADWDDDQKRCYKLKVEKINAGELCRFGPDDEDNSSPELFFWGDSHAAAYLPAIKEKSRDHSMLTVHASKSGCIPILWETQAKNVECIKFNNAMIKQIKSSGVTTVLLAGRWSVYIYGEQNVMLDDGSDEEKTPDKAKKIFINQFKKMSEELKGYGVTLWVAKQVPLQAENIPHVLTKLELKGLNTSEVGVSLKGHQERQQFVNSVFSELEEEGVLVLDPTPWMCRDSFCPASYEGVSYYKDKDHLSVQGASKIKDLFEPVFLSLH